MWYAIVYLHSQDTKDNEESAADEDNIADGSQRGDESLHNKLQPGSSTDHPAPHTHNHIHVRVHSRDIRLWTFKQRFHEQATWRTSAGAVFAANAELSECPGSGFHWCTPESPECPPETQIPTVHPERSSSTEGRSASRSRTPELQPVDEAQNTLVTLF